MASASSCSSTAHSPSPVALFSCSSLRRLYLGAWVFPDTTTLPRGAAFPNLRELVLGCVIMENKDLDFVLAANSVLEILAVVRSQTQLHARLASHSQRCAQFCLSTVVDAPRLERLFIWCSSSHRRPRSKTSTRVKIGHAPQLRLLGYLWPGAHTLQIGDTIIKAGTQASPSTIVSSVEMLALNLRFGERSEVKMLPSFLRCFPNVEVLCIQVKPAFYHHLTFASSSLDSIRLLLHNLSLYIAELCVDIYLHHHHS